jgi:hypothetical protein
MRKQEIIPSSPTTREYTVLLFKVLEAERRVVYAEGPIATCDETQSILPLRQISWFQVGNLIGRVTASCYIDRVKAKFNELHTAPQ